MNDKFQITDVPSLGPAISDDQIPAELLPLLRGNTVTGWQGKGYYLADDVYRALRGELV